MGKACIRKGTAGWYYYIPTRNGGAMYFYDRWPMDRSARCRSGTIWRLK